MRKIGLLAATAWVMLVTGLWVEAGVGGLLAGALLLTLAFSLIVALAETPEGK